MQDLAPPPTSLFDPQGAPCEGAFAGAIPHARLAAGPLRSLRKKTWRYAGVFAGELAIGAAIADVGYIGLTFVYVAQGSDFIERTWKTPAAAGMRVGVADGASAALGRRRLVSLATTRSGGVTLSLALPGLAADIDIAGGATPLTVVSEACRGAGHPGFTVKQAGLPAQGTVSIEGRRIPLTDAHACLDFTEAFFRRRTTWCWATAGGRAADGRVVGFNLARGVHDDVQGRFTENALWIDGEPAALPPVHFVPGSGSAPWTITSEDGAVELSFTPRGERAEDVNFLVVSSRYRQPFGSFTGRLRDARGRQVRIDGIGGVTEDHDALW